MMCLDFSFILQVTNSNENAPCLSNLIREYKESNAKFHMDVYVVKH